MSGFVGIVHLDGSPVDPNVLQTMTTYLKLRGPDAHNSFTHGNIGLGHSLLQTTFESQYEIQPHTLDGQVYLISDARIDNRKELIGKLESKGCVLKPVVTDADLILHAYHTWGEACVEHLLGDFAFAIWDKSKQHLFAARDHFGVKLFYYALIGSTFLFSNTLNCLRLHPAISNTLDEKAIGDFLLFGYNCWPEATSFADIKRLPAAHTLKIDTLRKLEPSLQPQRYWTLTPPEKLYYKKSQDYVEHFKTLLHEAVHDRLRTEQVAVYMSGGLDSSMIAGVARVYLPIPKAMQAHTVVYDKLIPDQERYYSGLVAKQLTIPIHYYAGEDYPPFRSTGIFWHPEPLDDPYLAMTLDMEAAVAKHSRVVLTGDDGDAPLTANVRAHGWQLLQARKWPQFVGEVIWYIFARGRFPVIKFPRKKVSKDQDHSFPGWLDKDFAQRLNLQQRRHEINFSSQNNDPIRGDAYKLLNSPVLSVLLERYDAGFTQQPLEARHPLLDLRVVNYLLSLPPVPWCVHKELFRRATKGILPEAVCQRPKSPLAGDPTQVWLGHTDQSWRATFKAHPLLSTYADKTVLAKLGNPQIPVNSEHLRLFSLSEWLKWANIFTAYS